MDPFVGWFTSWLLVLVINGEMVEREEYDSRMACLSVGNHMVKDTLNPATHYWEIEGTLDGFFCEKKEPTKPEKVTAVCVAPTRHCS
jgi:hypothetical protein